ncbi:dehydrogenase [Salinimicrobium marinum]|uniref:Dehydrogenase n=1 Tax=Salinimicrobium marinum TaxID=680283 RepID=A0A918W2P8_9FLAO|nr:Gfo/Idh/MocA family oxidoreductase [Salinimicrobium marinum]GHA50013.1 dehydrogenase [Salinimicrobium marinum]
MKKNKIKWGILGPGRIAGKFALGLTHVKDAELYAIGSRSLPRAAAFAEEWKAAKAYGSYEEMLQDEALDVVYIATPHVFHFEHTLLCLRHKKAVLCEKPFAMNRQQVEQMIATARQENVFLMEAMWTQFLPHFRFVIDLLKSGKYGRIKNLKADFGFSAPFNAKSRLFNKKLGGGSLLDIGIYPVFLALSTLGKPEKITAKANIGSTSIDEDCDIIFHYPDNVKAEIGSSIIKNTPTTAVLELKEATILIHSRFHEPSTISITSEKGIETKEFGVTSNGYNFEAEHVQEMLKKGQMESVQMTFSKSLDLISLLDDIRNQIALEY